MAIGVVLILLGMGIIVQNTEAATELVFGDIYTDKGQIIDMGPPMCVAISTDNGFWFTDNFSNVELKQIQSEFEEEFSKTLILRRQNEKRNYK